MARPTGALPRRNPGWWPFLATVLLALNAPSALRSAAPAERVWTEFAQCKHFFPAGLPPVVPKAPLQRELCFDGFAILHDGQTKTPVFVAEHLDRSVLQQAGRLRRSNHFYAEARLPAEERAEAADYRHSGYSLGHMAPAGDMGTAAAKAQSFSLANMAPQDVELNNGAWNDIEQDTRRYVRRAQADVYVFTGPVYSQAAPSIGAGRVRVPQYFYKLVYDPSSGRSWVHWQPNAPRRQVSEPISYEELVRRTGIEFVPR
ncbi:DNA/RNA non-specific endonuclease [Comamonas endophytica]|uniref:DNA/RNA non-specific endonuclease n=1 Tax=Comamonas endophytica TaxID=2949090 RepID=A0ABY6G992_9BURK|nr:MULTISPECIES: DNA/RNA non-specific endonuclease [unclassified Acidovorax]MCD2511913.1 DNA/RNA non-specific endonuclease [Acidovorax sp. D4N7]UYG51631.1 DNA/RNA non-specific endonuclease [Acidovorax sp. 5MLIR]